MMKMSYNFKEQVNEPRQKQAVELCKNYLLSDGCEVTDVSEDPKFYKTGADLIMQIPDGEITIDVKCDFQAHSTFNIVVEFIEVASDRKEQKLGWIYNEVEFIYYVIWETKELIILDKKILIKICLEKELRGYASHHNKPFYYYTFGLLLPLQEARKHFKSINL